MGRGKIKLEQAKVAAIEAQVTQNKARCEGIPGTYRLLLSFHT